MALSDAYLARAGSYFPRQTWMDDSGNTYGGSPATLAELDKVGPGRYEYPGLWGHDQATRDFAFNVGRQLGLTDQQILEAAANAAMGHYNQFNSFYTEGTGPLGVQNMIKDQLFAAKGIPVPANVNEYFSAQRMAQDAAFAQSRQDQMKAADESDSGLSGLLKDIGPLLAIGGGIYGLGALGGLWGGLSGGLAAGTTGAEMGGLFAGDLAAAGALTSAAAAASPFAEMGGLWDVGSPALGDVTAAAATGALEAPLSANGLPEWGFETPLPEVPMPPSAPTVPTGGPEFGFETPLPPAPAPTYTPPPVGPEWGFETPLPPAVEEAAGAFTPQLPGEFGAVADTGGAATSGATGMDWLDQLIQQLTESGVDESLTTGGSGASNLATGSLSDIIEQTGNFTGAGIEQAAAPVEEAIRKTPGLLDSINQALGTNFGASDVASAAKTVAGVAQAGGSGILSDLVKIGLPAAAIAGLFEKPASPLTGALTQAANSAVGAADRFAAMPAVGMMPSSQRAIAEANAGVGAWQPYVDKAAAYTNKGAGGLPSVDLSQYMNPYLDTVLAPQIRDIEEAAARRRESLRATVSRSGNDFRTPGVNRFNVEDDLLDRSTMRSIGDASANARHSAFNAATGLATTDLNRDMTAAGAFNTMASTVGREGGADFTRLGAAGELEAKPQENALTKQADTAKLYTSVIPGTTSAVTATKNPSILGQAVGAFGAYNTATKPGGILENYRL